MISWPRALIETIRSLAEPRSIIESAAHLEARLGPIAEQQWAWLKEQSKEAEKHQLVLTIREVDSYDGYSLISEDFDLIAGRPLGLLVTKRPIEGIARFFTFSGLERSARNEPHSLEKAAVAIVAEAGSCFSTIGLKIQEWTDIFSNESVALIEEISPRRLIKNLSNDLRLPANIATWICAEMHGKIPNEMFAAACSYYMAISLPNEISRNVDGLIEVTVRGARTHHSIVAGIESSIWKTESLSEALSALCRWIYIEGSDMETRHALVATELARTSPENADWATHLLNSIDGVLEVAKLAYRLHLQNKGMDALRLLSDLRKALNEDVKNVTIQASTLSASLWRDAAVAFGATALKMTAGSLGFALPALVAVYLAISAYLSTRAANAAVAATIKNEKTFRRSLYHPLLPQSEYEELAGTRYKSVIGDYKNYRNLIAAVYGGAIGTLIFIAFKSGSPPSFIESIIIVLKWVVEANWQEVQRIFA